MAKEEQSGDRLRGRPLALDPAAVSSSPDEPALIAPPKGSPAYYGFQTLTDVSVDGFTLGKIMDFEAEYCDYGDAFVIAPDNSRAGLVWECNDTSAFEEVIAPEPERWGVWAVSFPHPMNGRENARRNLESVLPMLKKVWESWRKRGNPDSS